MQTNEGEKISQLIAGYIDIILKKVTVLNFFLYQLCLGFMKRKQQSEQIKKLKPITQI